MSETFYEIPVPLDLESIRSINDGYRWIKGVIPGSVTIHNGVITFVVRWNGAKRRFTMATELVGGYQCDE